ncbi:hypothetical protein E9993_00260 [Labilibacter sediminis]|nr:hypothetical protein E9993_00260 [Labilibacter sediminis]
MKKVKQYILPSLLVLLLGGLVSCEEEKIDLGVLPEGEVIVDSEDTNNPVFTANYSDAFLYSWDFGNGDTYYGYEKESSTYYPFAGEYEVKLVVSGKAGAVEVIETVVVESTDPQICGDEDRTLLTGGCADSDWQKTWVWSTEARANIMMVPQWGNMELHATVANELDPEAYDDEFTFMLIGEYQVKSDDRTLCNWPILEFGHTPDEGICTIENPESTLWVIEETDGKKYLNIGQSYIGKYEIGTRYEIIELTEDKLVLQKEESIYLPTQGWSVNGVRIMTFVPKQ